MPPRDLRLSLHQARLLHLAAQGLLTTPRRRARKPDVLAAIARLHVLQIDTINIVARSPYLVLFSRLGRYPQAWLEELLAEGALFECWAHEACFAPIEDYALHHAHRAARASHWAHRSAARVRSEHGPSLERLLAHVREQGPVKSSDFERREGTAGGWWGWKAEKRWLEALFALGELMVARREGFQRVYDLRERVLGRARPGWAQAPQLTPEEAGRAFTLRAVQALGVSPARWVHDYFRTGRRLRDADLEPLVASGELVRVAVTGWPAPGYVHASQAELARHAAAGRLRASRTTLLSPFDPVVWDRERARELFGFDYRLECYTPGPRRQFGYFVLPILRRGRLVGRLDAKAHRATGRFEVKAMFLEPWVRPTGALASDLARALRECAAWHETPRVVVRRSQPAALAALVRAELASGR